MAEHVDLEALRAQLTARWEDVGVDASTFAGAPMDATWRSPPLTALDSSEPSRELGKPGAASRPEPHPDSPEPRPEPRGASRADSSDGIGPSSETIVLGAVLGEGGMGVVHHATQTSLARTVAVKRLKSSELAAERRLMLEARITGALEHPNVVPVHALERDDSGRPMIVMKRIEGRAWSELLAEVPDERRLDEDVLREHLGILVQVSRALRFAHARRVIHRDVKPENVMLGSFDEVYLVDWGIAVSLDRVDGVPFAGDVRTIEGTPVYLAPEMAGAEGDALDERTDVYLLGATLFEILTGRPPHAADSVTAVLVKAFSGEVPPLPAATPSELARIVRRALARERDERFASAADFADAIEQFLRHRDSARLCAEAGRRADELAKALEVVRAKAKRGVDADADVEGREHARLFALFHEARFAYEQALAGWAESESSEQREATLGRRALIETMVRLELARGSAGSAHGLLREHDAPPEELEAEVAAALERERALAARMGQLEQLEHDADMRFGARTREVLTYLGSLSWGASLLACGITTRTGALVIDHARFSLVNLGFFVGTALATWVARRDMLGNAANRRVAFTSCLVFATGVLLWPVLGAVGVSMPHATVVGSLVAAALWTSATLSLGRAWVPLALGQLLVVGGAWRFPEWHFEIFGVVGSLQALGTARLMALGARAAHSSNARRASSETSGM